MTMEFVTSPRKRESPAVAINRIRMGLRSCRTSTDHALARCTLSALGPSSASRAAASPPLNPAAAELRSRRTCSALL